MKERIMTSSGALSEALHEEMSRDESIFIIGEDLVSHAGIFGQFVGIPENFPGRIIDTPISETCIVGSGLGAALTGMRPIDLPAWRRTPLRTPVSKENAPCSLRRKRRVSAFGFSSLLAIRSPMGKWTVRIDGSAIDAGVLAPVRLASPRAFSGHILSSGYFQDEHRFRRQID